jgi:hypothetical protein
MSIEDVIARIERGTRLRRPDGTLGGYVIEVDEWRAIRAALRRVTEEGTKLCTRLDALGREWESWGEPQATCAQELGGALEDDDE